MNCKEVVFKPTTSPEICCRNLQQSYSVKMVQDYLDTVNGRDVNYV